MKRIGNFLFVEQWFINAAPRQAIVNIDRINTIYEHFIDDEDRTVIETPESNMVLTGNHDDNIIELSRVLGKANEDVIFRD